MVGSWLFKFNAITYNCVASFYLHTLILMHTIHHQSPHSFHQNKQLTEPQSLASPHIAMAIPFPPHRNKQQSAAFALPATTASPPQKTHSPPTPHIPQIPPRAATTLPPSARPHSAQNPPVSRTAPISPDTCATTDSSPPRATSSSAGVSSTPHSRTESPIAVSDEVVRAN